MPFLLIFVSFLGEQVTFICNVSSGPSNVTNLSLVEVTKVNSKPSHQKVSVPITNLQIPEGSERHVRQFICETKYQQQTIRSELAELIIVKLGMFSGHHTQVTDSARSHSNHKLFPFPLLLFLCWFVLFLSNRTLQDWILSLSLFFICSLHSHILETFNGCLIFSRKVLALENRTYFA